MAIGSVSKLIAEATDRKNSARFSNIPKVDTRMDHSLSIKVGGSTIGRIQEWSPQQARNLEPIYEVNSAGSGYVSEQVPGIMTGLTINVTRFDLYSKKMEQAWGPGFSIAMLCDQTNPLKINEVWLNPDGTMEIWSYFGCWFSSLGRTHSATGDRITRVNATLSYTRKYKMHEIKSEIYDFVDQTIGAFGDKLA